MEVIVSSDDLRLVANQFHRPADALHASLKTLKSKLDDIGSPWNDDPDGLRFAESYLPVKDKTFEVLGNVAKGFRSYHTSFLTMANNYDSAEHSNRL
jgi:hypothetical protein